MQEISNSAELDRVRGIAESARLAADRVQRQVRALDSDIGRYERRGIRIYIAVLILIVVTAAGAWWLNNKVTAQEASLASLNGTEGAVAGLNQRLDHVETTLKSLPSQLATMANPVEAADKTAVPNAVPSQAEAPAPAPETKPQASPVREVTPAREIPQENTRAQATRARDRMASLVDRPDRNRRNFLVEMDRANELVPGILVAIKGTDVERQLVVDGWIYLQEQHRFIYLKNQRPMEPISVYDSRDNQTHDIVFTKIGKNDAIGFISSPKNPVSVSAAN